MSICLLIAYCARDIQQIDGTAAEEHPLSRKAVRPDRHHHKPQAGITACEVTTYGLVVCGCPLADFPVALLGAAQRAETLAAGVDQILNADL